MAVANPEGGLVRAVGVAGPAGAAHAVYAKDWKCSLCSAYNHPRRQRCVPPSSTCSVCLRLVRLCMCVVCLCFVLLFAVCCVFRYVYVRTPLPCGRVAFM